MSEKTCARCGGSYPTFNGPQFYCSLWCRAISKTHTEGACWIWDGLLDRRGYPRIFNNRRAFYAHRITFEIARGQVPDGLELDHLCRVPRCVNPDHLEPVTGAENKRRKAMAQTACKYGHEFNAENTRFVGRTRTCRICDRRRTAEYQARKRAVA